jgi:hypothetical protein
MARQGKARLGEALNKNRRKIMDINENKFTQLFNHAIERLDRIITSDQINEEDRIKIKACQSIIASYPRYRQAQADIASVTIKVIKESSETEAQYREILKAHMPRIAPLVSLPGVLDQNRIAVSDLQQKLITQSSTFAAERQELKEKLDNVMFENMQLQEKIKQK